MTTKVENQQQILIEHFGAVEFTLDEATKPGSLFVEGKCGHAGRATANKREYPLPIMEREIKKLNERIGSGMPVLGSLDHPSDGKSRLKDSSHLIHKIWMESDGTMKMRAEVMEETENGKIAAAIIRRTGRCGMSSRGMGSTSRTGDGREVVNEDYKLATFDFVADPAVADAYPTTMGEDLEDDVLKNISPETIRQQFPVQVEALEENARLAALQTIRQTADTAVDKATIVQSALDEYKDQIHTTVYEEAKGDLMQEFGVKLVRALQEMRSELDKKIRLELASDPREAGAKVTLTKLAEMLVPYRPSTDVKSLLADKDKEIADLQHENEEAVSATGDAKAKTVSIASKAKALAFENHVLKAVAGRDDSASIIDMVGDLSTIETAEQLQERLAVAIDRADSIGENANRKAESLSAGATKRVKQVESRERNLLRKAKMRDNQIADHVEKITSRMQERLNTLEAENVGLQEENRAKDKANDRLVNALERSEVLIERLDDYSYAERRTKGHPSRDGILEDVRRGRVKGRSGINTLAEVDDLRGEESGGVNERIRRAMSRGREFAPQTLTESTKGDRDNISDLAEFGLHVDDILPLSRGNRG